MPRQKRIWTKIPGVYYIEGKGARGPEKIYYIVYRRLGKLIEEKAGRQFQDDMTPTRAAKLRAQRIEGDILPNKERREAKRKVQKELQDKWTLNRLWEYYESQKDFNKSIQVDQQRYHKYFKPLFGNKEPYEINQEEIDKLRKSLLKNLKPQTVKHILGVLTRLINFGIRKGKCSPLLFKVEVPKINNIVTEFLTRGELKNLFETISKSDDIQASNLMLMAVFTGMRRGELLRLQWGDVDFERGFIHIRNPKGGVDQKIPLNPMARKVLDNHPRISKYIFCYDTGEPFKQLHRRLRRLRDAAGLPKDFRPMHGLRHTFASMLASSGQVDLYVLQRLLTHKSPMMTQRYAHLRDESLKKASGVMGELIGEVLGVKK